MTATLREPVVAYRGWPVLLLVPDVTHVRPGGKTLPAQYVDRSWWERAACKGGDPSGLFAGDGEPLSRAAARMREFARRYCTTCPVFDTCGNQPDEYGVWAGALRHRHKRVPLIPRAHV